VLDPFIGSGTVAVAAETYGRDWIGIELNLGYAKLARERIAGWRMKNKNPQP
jgi:site-specific DNA-methyltransferase (adenine-specific)